MSTLRNLPKSRYARNFTKKEMEKIAEEAPLSEKLFRHKFQVYIPAAYLYSEEDFALGVIVSGDKERDTQAANEIVTAYLPIAPDDDAPGPNILEFFEQEVPCTFRYETDVTKVYNILMEHFKKMAMYMGENPLMNPQKRERIIADLTRFDVLAAKLHPSAHTLLPQHLKANSVEARIMALLRPVVPSHDARAEKANQNEPTPIPEYKSFEVGLSPSLLKGTKRWQ